MARRTGDTIVIRGDYQHRALTRGNPVQRFWHYSKQLAIRRRLLPCAGDRVLDVGCGSGVIASFLGDFAASVVGIDGNPDAVGFAAENFARHNVRFEQGLVDETYAAAGPVDKIYCLEVIEHIHPPQARAMLRAFRRLLRPRGKVLLTTPNYRSLWPLIERFMDLLGLAPPLLEHQHVAFYNSTALAGLCRQCGFVVERIRSCCLAAPWVAPLSRRLAEKIDAVESRLPWPVGSILVCVLEKRP